MQFFQHKASHVFNWFKEIRRLQGQYAVSWVCGLFVASFITPIVMCFSGPVIAGKVGMTLSITASLINIANVWVMVNIPQFNMLVAQHNTNLLDKMFKKIQRQISIIYLIGGVFLIMLLAFVFPLFHWEERILPLSDFLILLAAGFIAVHGSNMAFYLRAHKEEPYMWLSVISAVMTGSLVTVILYFFNSVSMAIGGYVLIQFISFYFVHFIFREKKREYNSQLRLVGLSYE